MINSKLKDIIEKNIKLKKTKKYPSQPELTYHTHSSDHVIRIISQKINKKIQETQFLINPILKNRVEK